MSAYLHADGFLCFDRDACDRQHPMPPPCTCTYYPGLMERTPNSGCPTHAEIDANPHCEHCGQRQDIHGGPNQGVHHFVSPPSIKRMTKSEHVLTLTLPSGVLPNDGQSLRKASETFEVPVLIDPTIGRLGQIDLAHDWSYTIRLREWDEQVLLHEVLHALIDRFVSVADAEVLHDIVKHVEVGLTMAGYVRGGAR